MRGPFILTPLLLAAALSRADVTITEKQERKLGDTVTNGTTTMKIKGDLVRLELGSTISISDIAHGTWTDLTPAEKKAMVSELKRRQAVADAATEEAPKLKPTGKSEKVGDWNADIYEGTTADGAPIKVWVAKDFPNAASINAQMDKVSKAGVLASYQKLDGMTVKTEMTFPTWKLTSTLVSVKEDPLADSEFTVPSDYKVDFMCYFGL